nr:MAG TPA: hypothetical protein [Caudoviricetes sp.]
MIRYFGSPLRRLLRVSSFTSASVNPLTVVYWGILYLSRSFRINFQSCVTQ